MKKQSIGSCEKKVSILFYRKSLRLLRTKLVFLLSTACLCTLLSGCGGTGTEEEEVVMSEQIPVRVQQPEPGTLVLKDEFMGTVSPEESVYVIPMVTAEVLSTNVSLGDEVEAGTELCKLDSEPALLQLASAQEQYHCAEAGVNSA